jgi:VWFA-related protein
MSDAPAGFVRHFVALPTLLLVALGAFAQQPQTQPPTQPPGTIRTRITMVPLDVRVLDRNGKPVTDLKLDDFTVTENRVPQAIKHFSVQSLTADPSAVTDTPALRKPLTTDLTPQNRRVFLLLIGRGRMTGPSNELRALDEFVRTRLLPQDQVAFLAYNRATDFTTDHRKIAAVIASFKARHTKIESLMAQHFSGLQAVYGSRQIPPAIQKEIDALFQEAGALRPREITPGQITDRSRLETDNRRIADELQRAEILKTRPPDSLSLPDPAATETADTLDMTFDEFVSTRSQVMQDLNNLYSGIEYLRYLDGEKHLAFVTAEGLMLPRVENDTSLAAVASDARVAIHILFTGGTVGAPAPRFLPPSERGGGRIEMSPVPRPSAVFRQTFNVQTLRRVADLTGGHLTAFSAGEQAFRRLDQGTRFQYLLGYYPSNANWNGAYRRIEVTVNRPGVTVHYRHGYYASHQLVPLDRREFLTYTRMAAAARYTEALPDIRITLKPSTILGDEGARELLVQGTMDLSRVKFTRSDERHVASLEVGIYAGDARERVVGETLKKVDLRLTDDSYRAMLRDGGEFNARLSLSGEPRYVKVIVYDYASDLLGTAIEKLKKPD